MAAPHVAGVAALYLSLHPNATPHEVKQIIVEGATRGRMDASVLPAGTSDKIVYSLINGMAG